MRILYLSPLETVILDILAWILFHLSIGYATSRLVITHFDPNDRLYQTKPWEKNGEIYQKLFRVKDWKKFIPSGAALYKNAYEIKRITSFTIQNIGTWLRESCRSEFCHIMMILPGFFFFLWNSIQAGWWMVAYAFANNLIPIIMQRYNRPRIRTLLEQLENKNRQQEEYLFANEPEKILSDTHQ